ncbi:MAG: FAD-dependent monooxygenase [Cyanobacteria bacterium SBC]|nr:FAD-dependent monooxygenase [Cyanobacteria bacterium SBC]
MVDAAFLGDRAVVIGGSLSGFLAARVLSDFFKQVIVLERARYPVETPAPRKGIPQCTQLHVLLTRGRQIIEDLFPGLEAELLEVGAVTLDMGADVNWLNPFGWAVRFPSGFETLSFSRYILDWLVHRRLSQFSNVEIVEARYVQGLRTTLDRTRVTGVVVRPSGTASSEQTEPEELIADLVVDTSGYSSQIPKWLQAIGYNSPEEATVTTSIEYASRIYEIPQDFQESWRGVYIQAAPPERTSMGVLYPIENNRWMVSVCATAPNCPSTEETEFLKALQNLPSDRIYNAVKRAKPLTSIQPYRPSGNRLYRYERLKKKPQGLIALGDSVCSFTPIYGQGITVAALGAVLLQECLQSIKTKGSDLSQLPTRFHQQLAKINTTPWIAATSQDAKYPTVKGINKPSSLIERVMGWYIDRLIYLTTQEPRITLALFNVFHMLRPSSTLFRPFIVWRVFRSLF